MRVKELAAWLEAPWEGEGDREIRRVASLEDAGDEDLSFVSNGRSVKLAGQSRAACLLVPADFDNEAITFHGGSDVRVECLDIAR